MLTLALKQTLHEVVAAAPGVTLAIVFGSTARGQEHAGSDLDVAVVCAPQLSCDVLELSARLSVATGREVDVVDCAQAPIPLLDSIITEGVVVFERERGAEAQFRSRTLAMLETDRPWYRRMRDAWLQRVAERGLHG